MSSRSVAVAAGVMGLVVAAWLGASIAVGWQAEAALQELKNTPHGASRGPRLVRLVHERSLLNASGQAELAFEPGCTAQPGADEAVTVRVNYTMSHLILPGSLTRFEWQATPLGSTANDFRAVFGAVSSLEGHGAVALDGALRTDMSFPELSVQRAGTALLVAPSSGFLSVKDSALSFGWKIDRLVTRGGGQAMEAKGLSIDMDLRNRHLGTGTAGVGVEQLSLSVGSLEGLSLRSEAVEKGDRLDMQITPSIRRLKAGGMDFGDLSLEIALQGLDTRSVETLTRLFEATCGMQSLTADEGIRARDAAVRLIARGLSVGISKMTGKSADGSVNGRLMLQLTEARDGRPSLAAQLRSNGRLELTGKLLTDQQREFLVSMGFAIDHGTGLASVFEYGDGLLKLNDRTLDAGTVLTTLQAADERMQALVAGWSRSRPVPDGGSRPGAEVPEAAEPVLAEASASPAPAASAAGRTDQGAESPAADSHAVANAPPVIPAVECTALATCVRQILVAAGKADAEQVRRVANTIDAMPKPDTGNRPASRQFNQAGLEALKREDFAVAVARLRKASAEDPRDVEVAGNLGYALVKAGHPLEAAEVLQAALVLDPRRTSTWTPLAEAYALAGRSEDAKAALWVSFQWSANLEKSLVYYEDRVAREAHPALRSLYTHMVGVAQQQMAQGR